MLFVGVYDGAEVEEGLTVAEAGRHCQTRQSLNSTASAGNQHLGLAVQPTGQTTKVLEVCLIKDACRVRLQEESQFIGQASKVEAEHCALESPST